MRLLHCIRSLDPAGGGPIEALRQRLATLSERGIESEVACLDAPGAPWLKDFPARVEALGPVSLGTYGYSSKWTPWVRANCRRFGAVIINGLWQYHGFGTMRALPAEFPYFVFPHGMLDPWFKRTYPLKHLKKWAYWPWAEYRLLKNARAVLFTSEEERMQARQSFWLYRCNEQVVNYGTAGPVGDAAAQRELFFARHPELRGKRTLLFLGRVHVKKGPDFLLRAFASMLMRLPAELTQDVHLVMAGPNEHAYGQQMGALAGELGLTRRITWSGMLAGDLKWGAFHSASAFILPSHQENFGVSVAEALACGVPVLVSDKVNIWREVTGDQAGFVASDDVDGTQQLLEQWLRTPGGRWLAMRQNARTCYESRFTIERAASSLIRTIEAFGRENVG